VSVMNARDEELASINIIETMVHKMEFTLHLRGAELLPPYNLDAVIFYLKQPEGVENPDDIPPDRREKLTVDRRRFIFDPAAGA
jgi:hypothetical protein